MRAPFRSPEETDRVVDAAVRFIAKTEVPLSLIPLEDLLGQDEQPNLPGTVNEHPNWRRRLPVAADAVLEDEAVARRIEFRRGGKTAPVTPRATMRLQLHKGFTFADAAALVPYLGRSGHQPCLFLADPDGAARARSTATTWSIRPRSIPNWAGSSGLRDFVAVLRGAGLGLIVDIVPNHMAVGGADNPWWTDLLRHGRSSRYAEFFDIDWESDDPDLRGKVLAPFLGRPYGEALDAGDIQLAQTAVRRTGHPLFRQRIPHQSRRLRPRRRVRVESFDPANRDGRGQLHELLERQHYRLAWWGVAGDEINWRRFFDINGLAGLRIEEPAVFEATHATLFRLYADGLIDGFRVDHVDGLSDPPGYCRRLRQRLDELAPDRHAYLVVEKILGAGEALPTDWGVDGTSGYDFMNEVSALQHDASSAAALGRLWHDATQRPADFEDEEVPARLETLQRGFDAQLKAVTTALHRIARSSRNTRDTSAASIRRGLIALLSHFPVYRGYDADRSVGHRSGRVRQGSGGGEAVHPSLRACRPRSVGPLARRRTLATRSPAHGSSSSAPRSRQKPWRTPHSTAMADCCPATTSASMPPASADPSRISIAPARIGWHHSPTPCWQRPRMTTSAAKTCAPALR